MKAVNTSQIFNYQATGTGGTARNVH